LLIGKNIPLPMKLAVDKPGEVGTDRVISAAAAYAVVEDAVVVADFGTAVTIDLVDEKGIFLGGVICPGLEIGARALKENTSQLPKVKIARPKTPYGKTTTEAINCGLYYSAIATLQEVIRRYAEKIGRWPQTILTGSAAKVIKDDCDFIDSYVPNLFAAVMTGKGTGAISTIQLFGKKPGNIIKEIFKPAGSKPASLKAGEICLGTINNGSDIIDQVTIGCESPHSFAINCHGNPLIVSKLTTAEQLLAKILTAEKSINTIVLEAKLTQPTARTIEGTKIIANQIDAGLNKTVQKWLQNMNAVSPAEIAAEAEQILEASRTAKLIIFGCTAAIAGPPNTGKSTLLNCLAGRQKAIVTDVKGTTRAGLDEPRPSEGLGEKLAATSKDIVKKASQQKSVQILQEADLVLLVLDNSKNADQLDEKLLEKITDKRVLTVLNKSDLPAKFDTAKLPQMLVNTVQISAKFGAGIENLTKKIRQTTSVADFGLQNTVCITSRQENLLKQLKNAKSREQTTSVISELLNGRLSV